MALGAAALKIADRVGQFQVRTVQPIVRHVLNQAPHEIDHPVGEVPIETHPDDEFLRVVQRLRRNHAVQDVEVDDRARHRRELAHQVRRLDEDRPRERPAQRIENDSHLAELGEPEKQSGPGLRDGDNEAAAGNRRPRPLHQGALI